MKIPEDKTDRLELYTKLLRQCLASRSDRHALYQELRNYYLFGTNDASGCPYNKIESTIDTLTSFIYSPDGVKFSITTGTTADERDVLMSVPLAREVGDQWRMSGTNDLFGLGALWSHVFGTMLMKGQWKKGQFRSYLVEPHQFGVLREDVMELSDQEAFCMCYTVTKTQLETDLVGKAGLEGILARVNAQQGGASFSSEGLQRLLIGGAIGGVDGSVARGGNSAAPMTASGASYDYSPRVEAELVDMVDLYVWNDEENDYQLVTMANPDVIVWDRLQASVGVKEKPHFVVIRPETTLYDYFWGPSFVARLTALQDWRTERLFQIRKLLGKQVNPPKSASGFTGIAEEKMQALNVEGGFVGFTSPATKLEIHKPDVPEKLFTELAEIDQMFDDTAGIGHVLQGKGEPGVRSRGQADLMARLGSARPKKRALAVEGCAQNMANLILCNVQEHSPQRFKIEGHQDTYIAAQFTKDFEVHVDSHSASPIFVEDRKRDAAELLEVGAIDQEVFLEMFDPPNVQVLKLRLRAMKAAQAKEKQEMMAAVQQGGGDEGAMKKMKGLLGK